MDKGSDYLEVGKPADNVRIVVSCALYGEEIFGGRKEPEAGRGDPE